MNLINVFLALQSITLAYTSLVYKFGSWHVPFCKFFLYAQLTHLILQIFGMGILRPHNNPHTPKHKSYTYKK